MSRIGLRAWHALGLALVGAGLLALSAGSGSAGADPLPYRLPVALPGAVSSPAMAGDAPWTPLVRSLMHQLEPAEPDPIGDARPALGTTTAQLLNVDVILHLDAANTGAFGVATPPQGCTAVGYVSGPTGTDPMIPAQCWTDAQGVNVLSGDQLRETTATMNKTGLASSWDPGAFNAWGQAEGREGRALGITGIYGPQVDLMRVPNWGRDEAVLSEDPLLAGVLGAAETNGIQGRGLMSQVKHFAFYDGQTPGDDSQVQDQAAHQLYLTPYEWATSGSGVLPHPGEASSLMCSYANFQIVNAPGTTGTPAALSPSGGAYACNHPVKNLVGHDLWHWAGFFGTDYITDYQEPILGIESGSDQDFTTPGYASSEGAALVAAVQAGVVPLSTFNLAAARILYQLERFHMLGHPGADSNYLSPSNPTDTAGAYAIPTATKDAAEATVERGAEEGGVLLKDVHGALPLSRRALRRGVLVVGESAEYMSANPGSETAAGYPDRDAISPLEQLRSFAPKGSKITFLPYMPGADPSASDGIAVPRALLSTDGARAGSGLDQSLDGGAVSPVRQVDFTRVSGHGQLGFGHTYTWSGYVDVPSTDAYTFRFQFSVPSYSMEPGSPGSINAPGQITPPACTGSGAPSFSFASAAGTGTSLSSETLSTSPSVLGAENPPSTDPTMSGYTERGLANCDYAAGTLSPGMHRIQITWTAPASFDADPFHMREPGSARPSFRFAVSRLAGDEQAALSAARHAAEVVVFDDCSCVNEEGGNTLPVNAGDPGPTQLVEQMAAQNHNTVVVTNFNVVTLLPWIDQVPAVLQMWYPGSEGGTATARLLLGRADPSGHLTETWPGDESQTIYGTSETRALYPGDNLGTHAERFTGSDTTIPWDEGLFMGYRFWDRERIRPLFPFGWGLSYTHFRYRDLSVRPSGSGADVSVTVMNTGSVAGAAVPQVYLGPAPSVPSGVQQAERSLVGWDRVALAPHQRRRITIHIGPGASEQGWSDPRAFQYWSTAAQRWRASSGPRRIWVASADTPDELALSATVGRTA